MSDKREVVILSGVRTAIGGYGGSLKDFAPSDLAARVVKEAVSRAKVDPKDVGHCVFGTVIHTEPRDMYLARVACVNGGLPHETPALTLNRLCGSGMQAIVSAAQHILLGDIDCAVAGGAESMSRGGYLLPSLRWGARMANVSAIDMMVGALTDPFDTIHMGVTAENVAARCSLKREEQDAYAAESHRRAALAQSKGIFKDQILPIEIKGKKGVTMFETDEHVRADTTAQSLAKMKAVFQKDNGTVTAGNASGINDAAAAVVLMEKSVAEKKGLKPMGRMLGYSHSGVDPKVMGLGPVTSVKKLMEKTGLKISDLDLIESNEAFAAQAMGVSKELGLDKDRVNPNGGAIALGHPIGATGCILTIKALYELQRSGGRYALVTIASAAARESPRYLKKCNF